MAVMAAGNTKAVEGLTTYGSSIPVPSVQEIVRKDPAAIPERYVRTGAEKLSSVDVADVTDPDSSGIPVLDLHLLSAGDEDERKKLDSACKLWGFFQLVNHGISEDTLLSMRETVAGFFDLPLENKTKYAMALNDVHGYGQAYVVSEDQKLDWNDLLYLWTIPEKARVYRYWPEEVADFRRAIDAYSKEMERVSVELLASISSALGMDEGELVRLHGDMKQSMRLNYYPRCSKPEEVIGVSPHSDGSSITVLLQEDDLCGLQIRHEARWLPVVPISGALVVNIGDALEFWTNGVYRSVEHRAVVHQHRARMSVATFVSPREDVQIGPLDHFFGDQRPAMYKRVKYLDYIRSILSRKMEGKSHVETAKLQNAS